jgi:hypothetical protein
VHRVSSRIRCVLNISAGHGQCAAEQQRTQADRQRPEPWQQRAEPVLAAVL